MGILAEDKKAKKEAKKGKKDDKKKKKKGKDGSDEDDNKKEKKDKKDKKDKKKEKKEKKESNGDYIKDALFGKKGGEDIPEDDDVASLNSEAGVDDAGALLLAVAATKKF